MFTFNSTLPIAAIALHGLTNPLHQFLITTLRVVDPAAPADPTPMVIPYFAEGGGWTTSVILVNPADRALPGTVRFMAPSGEPSTVRVDGISGSSFAYSIPPRSSQKPSTSGSGTAVLTGSVRVVPSADSPAAPSGSVLFSFAERGTTLTEAGVPADPAGTAFRT